MNQLLKRKMELKIQFDQYVFCCTIQLSSKLITIVNK